MRRTTFVTLLLLFLSFAATSFADDIPYLTGRVVDNAQILSPDARARLTARLEAYEDATADQIVVLTVPTIQPVSIEEYAVRVFQAWKLGQKGKDNGVLIVVVPQDHKMRIEVGYGLEATLPDGACGQIIRAVMTPAFKQNNYDKGVEDGVGAIIGQLEGHGTLPAEPRATARAVGSGFPRPDMPWPQRILIGVFVFTVIGIFTVIGVVTPGSGWFLYVFLIPFWAMFPMFIIGPEPTVGLLAAYLIGFPIAKMSVRKKAWYLKAAQDLKTKGAANLGGFITLGAGGSGFSSGGGGFSGGGGSSGGGGASGSW